MVTLEITEFLEKSTLCRGWKTLRHTLSLMFGKAQGDGV